MPNGFGASESTLAPLYDPRRVHRARDRFLRDRVPELANANSFYVPSGRYAARGWLLLRREDYDKLGSLYNKDFVLQIEDFKERPGFKSQKLTFGHLAIVQARCLTTGLSADDDALYLVELTDQRGLLYNRYFMCDTNSQFNVRAPAYPSLYYENTLNAGTPHTWSTMIESLWDGMSAFLGPYPGLPAPPAGTPEGWIFPGASCWSSMCDVLDYLGLTVACDLTQANPYTIVTLGAPDAAFTALQTKNQPLLLDDLEWIDVGAGRVPGEVVVYFHRRNEVYGTEETVRRDSLQWQSTPLYSVTVPAPAFFAGAPGTHYVWSGFTVRYDVDNNPLPADVATAATIALDEVTSYFARAYRATAGSLWQLYAGALPFVTGSLVDGVCYREDFRPPHDRQGWLTEVARGCQPPWPLVEDEYVA